MCGRMCCSLNPESIKSKLHKDNITAAEDIEWVDEDKYHSSYNMCPTRYIVTMVEGGEKKRLQSMQWGYVPKWSTNPDMKRPINARIETLMEGNMYQSSKQKRCVVIADGFFEWKKLAGNQKQPHFIKRKDGELMIFAGLYDQNDKIGEKLITCAIITTHASKSFSSIHNRMPVILEKKVIATWINNDIPWSKPVIDLLKPFEGELECYQVSKDVGSVANDYSNLIVPVDSKKSSISFFMKKEDPKLKFEKDNKSDEKQQKGSIDDSNAPSPTPSDGSSSSQSSTTSQHSNSSNSNSKKRKANVAEEFNNTKKKAKQEQKTSKITNFFGKK